VAADEVDFGLPKPETIDVTFAYLGGGIDERTTPAGPDWVKEARRRLDELTSGIESAGFDPNPGEWCAGCDFLRFCEAGQAEVST
jgi:D-alanyl-D-alanine dipeptidase